MEYRKNSMLMAIVMIALFCASFMPTSAGEGTREGEGNEPYCTFGMNTYSGDNCIGSTMSVLIYARNMYSGSHWQETYYPSVAYRLYLAKLSVLDNEVTDEDGNHVDVIEPTDPGSLNPDNNNGWGYNISSGNTQYFYRDDDLSIRLAFMIKRTGVRPGTYRLPLRLSFQVAVKYDTENPGDYIFSSAMVQSGYVSFTVYSNINGMDSDTTTLVPEENGATVVTYSGAKYLTIRTPNLNARSGKTLSNMRATLEFIDSNIYVQIPELGVNSLTSGGYRYLRWKVDIDDTTSPGFYSGTIVFSYMLDDKPMQEAPFKVRLKVEATPLLGFPDSQRLTVPTAEMTQKSDSVTISIPIQNTGNIDLKQVRVRMDLDSSGFFKEGISYHDEDDWSAMRYQTIEQVFEDLSIEQTVTATFVLTTDRMLPPGNYLITLDYSAMYIDPFDDTGAQIRLQTFQWDEIGEDDFMDIMFFRSDPRQTDLMPPHILLKVNDDTGGPDISIEHQISLERGDKDVPVTITIKNKEMFAFTEVSYRLTSNDPGLVSLAGSDGKGALIASADMTTLPAMDSDGIGTLIVYGRIDVTTNRSKSRGGLSLDFSAFDIEGGTVVLNFTVPLEVQNRPANLELTEFSTGPIEPGEEFELRIGLMNTGGSPIEAYSIMLCSGSNMVTAESSCANGADLEPGETSLHTFRCMASEAMDHETACSMRLMVNFIESDGTSHDFDETEPKTIELMSSKASEPEELKGDLSILGVFLMFGLIIGGLFISIAFLLSVVILSRSLRGQRDPETKEEKEPPLMTVERQVIKEPEPEMKAPAQNLQNIDTPPDGRVQQSVPRDPLLDEIFSNP